MKDFFHKFIRRTPAVRQEPQEELNRQVTALYSLYAEIVGPEKIILKAGKLEALELMKSDDLGKRVLALQKLVYHDPVATKVPAAEEIPPILEDLAENLADMMARQAVEDEVEKKINEKMEEKHQEYIREIKMQLIKEESDSENSQTLKKLENLEKLQAKKLSRSAMELLRPATLAEIIGQERAIEALRAKLASPYPQHLLVYGPPGVGKTTAARLVLEEAKKLRYTPFTEDAPFVEVDGTTLRWDPRDMTNPLLGSVHDPIYQGARKDLADSGVPEPKPGLATDAHGGILFIDEIGEMDPMLLNKLLKVLEDKTVSFDSAYYDPADSHVPQYIRKLFEEGAPADFILIGATTRESQEISPAIRSRCAEIYFEPLTPVDIQNILNGAAAKLQVELETGVAALISEYTIEGRKAINILADAYGLALYHAQEGSPVTITAADVYRVTQVSRLTPYVNQKASDTPEVGKIFGLGVAGHLGSVLEVEAVAFPAHEKGKGSMRFNETAGSMAKDSVFNAVAVVRKLTGRDLTDYDVHVNIIGGGRIDGPSAGVAMTTVLISALTGIPIRQDRAVTGEVSIQGRIKAVGGVFEKAYGAKQAGMRELIIPADNAKDIPDSHLGLQVHPVAAVEQALELLLTRPLTPDQTIAQAI